MDFEKAIEAHIRWKVKLARFVDGHRESGMRSETAHDHRSGMGRWIFGDATKYESLPHYRKLVNSHADFQLCAADAMKQAETGDRAAASSALRGPVAAASRQVVAAVMELKKAAAQRRPPESAGNWRYPPFRTPEERGIPTRPIAPR